MKLQNSYSTLGLQDFYKILVMVLHGACNTITRVE